MSKLRPAFAFGRVALLLLSVAVPGSGGADDLSSGIPSPELSEAVSAAPPKSAAERDAELTGRDIYERVLDNTFHSFVQVATLRSGDRGGNEQFSTFQMWYQSEEVPGVEFKKGDIVSKSRVRYTEPFDIRHSGYLVLSRNDEVDDQFVYMPSQRRVKRVNLRGEAVFGTDFSFEDILPRELEDASYERQPDEETLGRGCFVVEAIPNALADSEYSRILVHVDKATSVPLLTRYWDDRGVEIKELRVEPESLEEIDGVWIARKMTMRQLKNGTYTRFELSSLEPNPKLAATTFEVRSLESRGR